VTRGGLLYVQGFGRRTRGQGGESRMGDSAIPWGMAGALGLIPERKMIYDIRAGRQSVGSMSETNR